MPTHMHMTNERSDGGEQKEGRSEPGGGRVAELVWSLNLFFGLLASAIFLTILLLLPCLILAPSVQVVFPCTPLTVKFFRNVSLHKNAKKVVKLVVR